MMNHCNSLKVHKFFTTLLDSPQVEEEDWEKDLPAYRASAHQFNCEPGQFGELWCFSVSLIFMYSFVFSKILYSTSR